jgi:hypothetical protein
MELDGIGRGIRGALSKHLPAGHQENYENLKTAGDWTKIPNRHLSDTRPDGYTYTKTSVLRHSVQQQAQGHGRSK